MPSPAGGNNTAKGTDESHGRRRDFDGSGQVAITAFARARYASRKKSTANDPRGRRLQRTQMNAPETRGAKNRTGEPTSWRGCRGRSNAEAGWPEAGKLRAVRRDRRTPQGHSEKREPQERCPPDLFASMMRAECRGGPVMKATRA